MISLNENSRNEIAFDLTLFVPTQGNETLFPNWQKESWQTFQNTSGHMRPERVNKWPNSMTDI